jgi:hypothetical protein
MPDEDLRTMVREFRARVAADLEAQHRRLDDFRYEMRRRLATMETAIVNEIRDLAGRMDRRIERVEIRLDEVDGRLEGLELRLDGR